MKSIAIDSFTPNKNVTLGIQNSILTFWIVATMLLWVFAGSHLLPSIFDILGAFQHLFLQKNFAFHLIVSTMFCLKALGWAVVVSFILAYASVLPFFRPLCAFVAKARFLSTAGLTFLAGEITNDTNGKKLLMLSFAITVFLVTSMLSVVMEVKKEELDYARTLRFNEWRAVWEVIIRGKIDLMLDVIRQNFAIAWMMLAMTESICRAEGGIGVLLGDSEKHFKLEEVFAIQITILIVGIGFDWFLRKLRAMFFPYSVLKLERK